MSSTRLSIALLTTLIGLVTYFLWPSIAGQQFFGFADNGIHGLPLTYLHQRILTGDESALWSPLIYGGHPLFAESQGAFASPVNIVLSYFLPPVIVSTVLHWFGFSFAVAGMFALARVLRLSVWASAFAALAAVFSPFWLTIQANMTVIAAVAWVPWTLFAFELWLKRKDMPGALLFGATTSMLILTGYPHLLHASVLFMVVSMIPALMVPSRRLNLLTHWRALLSSGSLAIIVTCGLCAVQLLPLLELIPQSHRGDAVKLTWYVFPESYYRGFFFSAKGNQAPPGLIMPSISSVLVCALALAALLWRPSLRFAGIALAAFLLGNLGLGYASPLFVFIYDHNLIPLIRKFRIMHPFFLPTLISVALLAGFALDAAGERLRQYRDGIRTQKQTLLALAPGLAAMIAVVGYAAYLYVPALSPLFLLTAIATLALIAAAFFSKRIAWLAPLAFALLLCEVASIKIDRPGFIDNAQLKEPAIVQMIPQAQRREYKFLNLASTFAFGTHPNSPNVRPWFDRMIAAVTPSSNLIWDVPSVNGAFALNLARQKLVEDYLGNEARGAIKRPPGLRLIDLLGVRYISIDDALQTEGLQLMRHDPALRLHLYANTAAQPRFQTYDNAIAASDASAAFDVLQHIEQRVLVIETDEKTLREISGDATSATTSAMTTSSANAPLTFSVIKAASDDYIFDVDATRGGWLFIADNMYPGWHALIDDQPAPLFAAQIMGKAVWVPAGKHRVQVRFTSRSFQMGLAITLVCAALTLYLAVVAWRRRHVLQRSTRAQV